MDKDASFEMDAPTCPSYHLTREQLKSTDFLSFVQRVFRERPDLPAFKIVPPVDWKPTQRRPKLDELTIQTPIKQLVRAGVPGCCCAGWAPCSTPRRQPTRPHVCRRLARQGRTDACWWKTRCALLCSLASGAVFGACRACGSVHSDQSALVRYPEVFCYCLTSGVPTRSCAVGATCTRLARCPDRFVSFAVHSRRSHALCSMQPCSVSQYRDLAMSEERLPPAKCAPFPLPYSLSLTC